MDEINLADGFGFEIVSGCTVSKDGLFILRENPCGNLHVGWWDSELKTWKTELNEIKLEVGNIMVGELYPVAKIVAKAQAESRYAIPTESSRGVPVVDGPVSLEWYHDHIS